MTPRQLFALRMQRVKQMQREELLVGIIASTSANFSFCRPEEAISAESFMLHPFPPDEEEDGELTGEDFMAVVARFPKST